MNKRFPISPSLANLPLHKLSDLVELQGDLKDLTKENYQRGLNSLTRYGIFVPFFVWPSPEGKLYIEDGHQRKRILTKEGAGDMLVPCQYIEADSLEDAKKRLLVISSQYGTIDVAAFVEFTAAFDDGWIDSMTHFDAFQFVDFDAIEEPPPSRDAEPQTSRADELQKVWQVEAGQLWRLPSRTAGQEHRLICGDCTDRGVVKRLMGGERGDGGCIDPPYGDGWVGPGWRTSSPKEEIENDKGEKFKETMQGAFPMLFDSLSSPSLLWCFGHGGKKITYALKVASWAKGFELNNIAPWDKGDLGMGQLLRNQWESILLLSKGEGIKKAWYGGQSRPNIFRQSGARPQSGDHPTPKPEPLIRDLVECVIPPSGICVDFFSGEGTTIVAAENLSRQCRAIEISPAYCAVILQRYQDAFGIEPELVG